MSVRRKNKPSARRGKRPAATIEPEAAPSVRLADEPAAAAREDTPVGTAGTHSSPGDRRAEEPFGEFSL